MGKGKGVYWRTDETTNKRKECLRKRREWVWCQMRKRIGDREYKHKKKDLKIMI